MCVRDVARRDFLERDRRVPVVHDRLGDWRELGSVDVAEAKHKRTTIARCGPDLAAVCGKHHVQVPAGSVLVQQVEGSRPIDVRGLEATSANGFNQVLGRYAGKVWD